MDRLVSILIPCFNAERWVRQAIESALAQTWPHKEVIVVDDGSTDGSAEIIARFGDRIRFERGPNRGSNPTRNHLLELARGDWLQYLDADDYLKPDKIASQIAALEGDPDVDVVFGPSIVEWWSNGAPRITYDEIPEPRDRWILLALWRLPQTGAPLWKKSALEDVGGWTVDQPCCQEHELYMRLLIAGKHFAYSPARGSVYRRFVNGTLSTRDPALVRRERLKIEARIESHLASIGELTPQRQWAINQGRLEMARIAWNEDKVEARTIVAAIKAADSFRPDGVAAPFLYSVVYRLLGFEAAEHIARVNRSAFRPLYQAFARGPRGGVD